MRAVCWAGRSAVLTVDRLDHCTADGWAAQSVVQLAASRADWRAAETAGQSVWRAGTSAVTLARKAWMSAERMAARKASSLGDQSAVPRAWKWAMLLVARWASSMDGTSVVAMAAAWVGSLAAVLVEHWAEWMAVVMAENLAVSEAGY